jgi:plasmid stability protein
MPGLLIKNLPKDLHDLLKLRASQNHRSLTKEALVILETVLRDYPPRPTIEQIRSWQVRPKKPITDAFLRRARTTGRL